ncbi:MAG: redoxin domain-containing protein, partial [Bacteroidales bacterium]|nr:redoxin domain-containing protein [Bacteroidales bacterium]
IKLIKSASYYEKFSASAPYDTLMVHTYERLKKMYINPEDTFIGAGYSSAFIKDSLKYNFCYDGNFNIRFNWENSSVQIDTLIGEDIHRPMAPFFIYTRSLLDYVVDNYDSVQVSIKNLIDTLKVNIYIKGKVVEFYTGKPIIRYDSELASKYVLWINTKTNLPFKVDRNMPHQKTVNSISNLKYSYETPQKFNAASLIPVEFKINNKENNSISTYDLKDKIAPDWKLMNINRDSIALNELKSKIILIQFTGIGCGPCHASVPFLKSLMEDYKGKEFELLQIETTNANIKALKSYHDKNELNCNYLISNKELNTEYKIKGVPVFLILDEKRIVKNVFVGFRKGVTEQIIVDALNQLL